MQPWKRQKVEPKDEPFKAKKEEVLSDADKIEKRIKWINDKCNLQTPIELEEVSEALECIGVQQAMKVLWQLQESAENVEDPSEFIFDMVARAGWIWARPDIIDDDVKVAKRVTWMNLFAGLQEDIDYAQVADALDALKVPHAMVLLRELEQQAGKIKNPTQYIKRMVAEVGEDEVEVPWEEAQEEVEQPLP
eukprot:2203103-Amphidinium_carterae.1